MGDHRISGCRTRSTPVLGGLVVQAICVETHIWLRWQRRSFLKTGRAHRCAHDPFRLGRGTRGADSDTVAARIRAPDPISGSCVFL